MSMGGSKKQAQPTTQTIVNETIPKWMQPYVEDTARRAQAISNQEYVPYKGPRQAKFDPYQLRAQKGVAALGTPEEFGQARAMMGDPGKFDSAAAQFYMSPYQSEVTDIAARKMQEESSRQQMGANLSAARSGAYGGGRQAVLEGMRGRDLMTGTGDLYAQQRQQSFLNAQEQFERDRAARLAGGQALMNLGTTRQQSELERYGALNTTGKERQAQVQQGYDTRYQDFLKQRDYGQDQLSWYSNIVRGLPAPVTSNTIAYTQQPSTAAQLAGAGISALGAYNAYKGT